MTAKGGREDADRVRWWNVVERDSGANTCRLLYGKSMPRGGRGDGGGG